MLWLPAMAHCQLESLTGYAFLPCHEQTAADSHSSSKDCTDCCAVEKSDHLAGQLRLTVPLPDLVPVTSVLLSLLETVQPPPGRSLDLTSAPPDLPARWHFLCRTALPVRAPSLTL
jgi:hypothetical protein